MPKAGIHPTYYPQAKVTCSCGAAYEIGATVESLKLDICRTCHPFYTGNQKLIDTAGRVDRFKAKMAAAKPSKKSEVKSGEAETPKVEASEKPAEVTEEEAKESE